VTVTVSDNGADFTRDDVTTSVARADADAVFLDGKQVVITDRASRVLVRETLSTPAEAVAEALRRHGFPWRDQDPYAEFYRPWTVGAVDPSPAAASLLATRQEALQKKAPRETRQLAEALQSVGVVVRDEGRKQSWRPLVTTSG
jgi:hypothetical protein